MNKENLPVKTHKKDKENLTKDEKPKKSKKTQETKNGDGKLTSRSNANI